MSEARERLLETIRKSLIGDDQTLAGPFGRRRITYADYTASGRSLAFIEAFLEREVLPFYANTHTTASGTGLQISRYREDARRIIHRAVGGGAEDVVIFCGSGATGAIHKLIGILNLALPQDLDARYGFARQIPPAERPVVFIGPYEHHSNEVPWRETIAEVVVIDEDADGHVDLGQLEAKLVDYADRPLKIGSFSAASNVTGILSDIAATSALLHRHGALAFWDYAAAGPYVKIEMNPCEAAAGSEPTGEASLAFIDALFLSPHKFVGGPGTPGVLVVKRRLLANRVPTVPGGGTVAYVSSAEHFYLADPVHREEGGTPAILESVRAGLVFQLKEAVGEDLIEEKESSFVARALAAWSACPNLLLLGNREARRLSIISFLVRHEGRFLHHNFVVALLNDLFGIQARGGCSCAGPYGHRLLGIDLDRSQRFKECILQGSEGIKPGWARVGFNYFISEATFQYLLAAVIKVAEHGWKLLPQYHFDAETGEWRHHLYNPHTVFGLDDISYATGRLEYHHFHRRAPESALPEYLAEADRIFATALEAIPPELDAQLTWSEGAETLRWFPLPAEAVPRLRREAACTRPLEVAV